MARPTLPSPYDPAVSESITPTAPSFFYPESVRLLLPHIHRDVEEESELWHLWRRAAADSHYFACKTLLAMEPAERDLMTWRTHGALCLFVDQPAPTHKLYSFPRKTLKSSIVTVRKPLRRLMQKVVRDLDPDNRYAILAYAAKTAQRHWWDIKTIFEKSERFQFFFPDLDPSAKWNEWLGSVVRSNDRKEPSFEAIAKQSAAKHFDALSCDELIGEENWNSPGAVEEAIRILDLSNNLLEDESSELDVPANRWTMDDVNAKIHREASTLGFAIMNVSAEGGLITAGEWASVGLDEAVEEAARMMPVESGSVWPERLTKSYLSKLRHRLGPVIYSCQILNFPEDPSATEFEIERVHHGRFLVWTTDGQPRLRFPDQPSVLHPLQDVYIGWDPAMGGRQARSENAVVVVATTSHGRAVVIKEYAQKEDPYRTIRRFVAFCRLFAPWLVASTVEEVLFAKLLRKPTEAYARRHRVRLNLRKVKLPRYKATADREPDAGKKTRIREWLGPVISSGILYVDEACSRTMRQIRLFGVRGAPMDLVDALASLTQLWSFPMTEEEVEEMEEEEAHIEQDAGVCGYGESLVY